MDVRNRRALRGVVIMVTVTPRAANSLPMVTSGIMWLGVRYGRMRTWRF